MSEKIELKEQKLSPQIVVVRLENEITKTKVQNDSKSIFTNPAARLVEAHSHEIVMEVPAKFCAKGHPIVVELRLLNYQPALKLRCTAKVVEMEAIDASRVALRAKFLQYDQIAWSEMTQVIQHRQNEVSLLFGSLKGV